MDFKDHIKLLGDRVTKLRDQIHTEEATKNAFIMPFIQALGYDVFNPLEVVPEYITDIGIKKGEKIDYLILKDNLPSLLIECKHIGQNLAVHDGQLLRYFHVSKARFGLLTNGVIYRFYTDLVEPNKMDEKPFLEFNITEIKDNQVEELKKFHKSYFDVNNIVSTATDLKYTNELKHLIHQELTEPSEAFVRHFTKQVYPNMITSKVLEQFTALTKKSINHYISDLITDRLKTALNKETEAAQVVENEATPKPDLAPAENKIETTAEELEAFFIVKAILRSKFSGERIVHRDAQTYFAILLDDNNRKTLCRLYLSGKKKYIATINDQKQEVKNELNTLDDIYKYSDLLIKTADAYDKAKEIA